MTDLSSSAACTRRRTPGLGRKRKRIRCTEGVIRIKDGTIIEEGSPKKATDLESSKTVARISPKGRGWLRHHKGWLAQWLAGRALAGGYTQGTLGNLFCKPARSFG